MPPDKSTIIDTARPPGQVQLYALDHGPWFKLRQNLRQALEIRGLERVSVPTAIVLNDLLDNAVKTMHLDVFHRTMESDFGLALGAEQAGSMYGIETNEHGSQNIARACEADGRRISVGFPQPSNHDNGQDVLAQVQVPFAWARSQCKTEKLIHALGFCLEVKKADDSSLISLIAPPHRHAEFTAPALLTADARQDSLARICGHLGYGVIRFAANGEIAAASPSMLAQLGLNGQPDWAHALADAIPLAFHNDIVWGLALSEGSGHFENFRIRVSLPGASHKSILFNVSGFRDVDGIIHSLWQAVSEEEGLGQRSEGSILSGMRIHNITRHYVPQLVEQKAREAVRQGKSAISDEERRVAVLFCDIVGFTSYVECNADNESIVDILNFILRRVSHSVVRNRGFIDKFMGDSIMAIFDDPADALLAAIDMQNHSEDLNQLRFRAGQRKLQLRIGIHWGDVVICNVGTVQRLDWTAIGDVVNTAARIENGCQPGAILISCVMRAAVEAAHPGRFRFGAAFGLQAKGKREELAVCNVSLAQEGGPA